MAMKGACLQRVSRLKHYHPGMPTRLAASLYRASVAATPEIQTSSDAIQRRFHHDIFD